MKITCEQTSTDRKIYLELKKDSLTAEELLNEFIKIMKFLNIKEEEMKEAMFKKSLDI